MRRYLLLFVVVFMALAGYGQDVILVRKGDVQSLLDAIKTASDRNRDRDSERIFILIPDGYYDLGEKTLTRVAGNNIALIGQSMEGTIIRNAPSTKMESISKTAVLQNRGKGNYYQDLTLKNDLDYYNVEPDGRAVCLQDKGDRTICNRVRMLSYQDTYYSDYEKSHNYFQDSEIHGTIDFVCGAGDVWFERCKIVTEKRTADGSGRNVIAAPKTSKTQWGYIFNHCTVENIVSNFEYARGWNGTPHCIWLHTTLLTPERLNATRFDYRGMNTVRNDFREYGTVDATGRDIMPQTNVVTFTMTKKSKEDANVMTTENCQVETVMTEGEAARYTVENVFGDWRPDKIIEQMERKVKKLMKRL
jgi:hypothetical protein